MCDHVVVSFSGGLLTVDGCLIQVPRLARCAAFLVESDQTASAYCAKLGSRLPWDGVRNDGEASEDTSKSRCRVDCSSPCAVTVQRRTRSSGPARLAPAVEVAGTGASRRRWCELRTRWRCAEEQHALRWVHQEVWAGVPGDASELGGEGRRRAGGRRGGLPQSRHSEHARWRRRLRSSRRLGERRRKHPSWRGSGRAPRPTCSRIAHLAERFSVPVAPHGVQHVSLHLADSLPGMLCVEVFQPDNPMREFGLNLIESPREAVEIDEGTLRLATADGIGYRLN